MPTGFPPQPAYPLALDSDRTLFLVYNTSEAKTVTDNSAWEGEITIEPVGQESKEIWADNGFANISGEMFYYDAVEKNIHGKVFKLKRCLRSMGGKPTRFNPSGTWVRGFVMAEHHNQLVDATIAIERYIFDLEEEIAKLENEPVCPDDAYCAEVTLETNLVEGQECRETTMQYSVVVNGTFSTFNLDFGDGQSTSSIQSGTHTYAPGANIDPVVTVVTEDCTVIRTPVSRTKGGVPEPPPQTPTFSLPVPQVPDFPQITIPDFQQPNPQVELPQIVFPCLDVTPISTGINIPSIINIVPPVISFTVPSITPVTYTFGPAPTITPGSYTFGPAPSITPGSFTFGPAPSITPGSFTFGPAPAITPGSFTFGPAPTISPASFVFGPAPKVSPASFVFGPAPKVSPASFVFGPAPKVSPASFVFGPAPKVSPASFVFGPAPKLSNMSMIWGTPPAVKGASFNWGQAPAVKNASMIWGTPPAVKNASMIWGTPPAVKNASMIWGTPPVVKGASFNWGNTPSVTGSFYWGNTPSVTGSVNWGNVPSVTGSFTWGNTPSVTGSFYWGNTPSVTGSFTWGNTPSVTGSFTWGDPPKVSIEWGSVPTLSCVVTVECAKSSGSTPFRRGATLDENFVDDFNTENFDIEISDLGIPSEIKVVVPKFPDIKISHDIPQFIDIKSDIPNKIVLYQADLIPKEIKIVNESVIPNVISVDASGIPTSMKIDATSIPGFISLIPIDVPSVIKLDGSEIPESIKVVGIPDSIEVKMPSEIVARLQVPENLEIPLVYKGGPVPIQFDTSNLLGGDDQACFALVPCNKK
jgi:hypothetical protein